jgi:hypothetical protein
MLESRYPALWLWLLAQSYTYTTGVGRKAESVTTTRLHLERNIS